MTFTIQIREGGSPYHLRVSREVKKFTPLNALMETILEDIK